MIGGRCIDRALLHHRTQRRDRRRLPAPRPCPCRRPHRHRRAHRHLSVRLARQRRRSRSRYRGGPTRLVVGTDCDIREGVTMNIGTEDGRGITEVGDRCFFMAGYSHVGHDCQVGNDVIFANSADAGRSCASSAITSFIGGLGRRPPVRAHRRRRHDRRRERHYAATSFRSGLRPAPSAELSRPQHGRPEAARVSRAEPIRAVALAPIERCSSATASCATGSRRSRRSIRHDPRSRRSSPSFATKRDRPLMLPAVAAASA